MKRKINALSLLYVVALRAFLKPGAAAAAQAASGLGRQAVVLGLETLELARIHERALVTLEVSGSQLALVKRAEVFFTEAITPIVETHRAAQESKIELGRLNEALVRRTAELAVTNRHLESGVVQRKSVEAALKKSGAHYGRLLKDSLLLQAGLRQLTHKVLAAHEEERRKMSRELQDEIAQTLLGIHVRLLSLRQEARGNTKGLRNEIANTRRLVVESAKSVRRVAGKYKTQ